MEDIASAAGYLGSSVFGIIVPLLAVIYGIATGTRAITGDEEAGYLDLLLAHPVSRTRLLLHRCAALAIGACILASLAMLAMLAVRPGAQLDTADHRCAGGTGQSKPAGGVRGIRCNAEVARCGWWAGAETRRPAEPSRTPRSRGGFRAGVRIAPRASTGRRR